jgi:DNA invertase Pin-like site-specific DNA recombinase
VPVLETFRTSFEPAKGASLSATEQPIDTSTAAGKCFLDMLGVFAEFETNVRGERQLERIGKAKAAGVYSGRRVQGQAGFDRRRSGTRNESPGARGRRNSQRHSRLDGRRSIGYWKPADAAKSSAGALGHRPPAAFLRSHPSM